MKTAIILTAMIVASSATLSLAHSTKIPRASEATGSTVAKIEAIYRGKGKPGDVVRSASNPDIVIRVTGNGSIERTNERYGTVETKRPRRYWFTHHSYRNH